MQIISRGEVNYKDFDETEETLLPSSMSSISFGYENIMGDKLRLFQCHKTLRDVLAGEET